MKKLIAARALLFCSILFFAAAAFGQAKSSAGKKSPRVYGEWKTSDVDCLLLDTDNYAWFFLDDGKDTVVAYGMYSYNLDFIKIKAANVWRVSEDSRTRDVDFVFPYSFDAENNLQIEAFGKKYHFTKYELKNGLYPPKDGSLDGTWTCKFYGTENGQKFCLDTKVYIYGGAMIMLFYRDGDFCRTSANHIFYKNNILYLSNAAADFVPLSQRAKEKNQKTCDYPFGEISVPPVETLFRGFLKYATYEAVMPFSLKKDTLTLKIDGKKLKLKKQGELWK